MSLAPLLAALVLVPVMVGPLPAAAPASLTAQLCNGGTVTIPLAPRRKPARQGDGHPKACHAGTCREDRNPRLISRKDGA
jgi:hypothetical protein